MSGKTAKGPGAAANKEEAGGRGWGLRVRPWENGTEEFQGKQSLGGGDRVTRAFFRPGFVLVRFNLVSEPHPRGSGLALALFTDHSWWGSG